MKTLRVIIDTLKLQMKNSFIRPMFRFCLIANPIVNTILIYEMFRNSGHDNFVAFVILGAWLMALWSCICFSSAGDINRERFSGTLAKIFTTPASFGTIMLGKILGNTILALLTLAISFITAKVLYNPKIEIANLGLLAISVIATIICFITFSIIVAYLLMLSRKTQLYMNVIEIPIILICGFVFPVEILPSFTKPISYAISPTWAVRLLRLSISGVTDISVFLTYLLILLGITALYAVISIILYKIIDKQVRINATLELF